MESPSQSYFAGICRCCLIEENLREENRLTFIDVEYNSKTYAELLQMCFSVNFEGHICNLCIKKLKVSFSFKTQVLKSQENIKSKLEFLNGNGFRQDSKKDIQTKRYGNSSDAENDDDVDSDCWDVQILDKNDDFSDLEDNFSNTSKDRVNNVNKFESEDDVINDQNSDDEKVKNGVKSKIRQKVKEKYGKIAWKNILATKISREDMKCLICYEHFMSEMMLLVHLNVHYPNHPCKKCGKAFATNHRLSQHVKSHNVGTFKCEICGNILASKQGLSSHVRFSHGNATYRCSKCPERFKSYDNRRRHLVSVHGVPKYRCELCSSEYILRRHIKAHIGRMHLKERDQLCPDCGMKFFSVSELTRHKTKHTGVRAYGCEICGNKYTTAYARKQHLRIHSNDRRFVCVLCGRTFIQKCTLKYHMRTHRNQLQELHKD